MLEKIIGFCLIIALLFMIVTYQQAESSSTVLLRNSGDYWLYRAEDTNLVTRSNARATLAIAYYLRDIRDELTEINLELKHTK